MNTQHTPGPWRISGNGREVYANHPDGFSVPFVVADCSGLEPFGPVNIGHHINIAKANAALIASAPDMAKEIAQLKQQNEELKAHEQELRNCWTEERTDHNKTREEIAQLRADKAELVQFLIDYRDTDSTLIMLERARQLISKHTKV